jgi:hypothetical protein
MIRVRSLAAVLILGLLGLLASVPAQGQPPPGGTFIDDDGNIHEPAIEAIAAAAITNGCNPPLRTRFCPYRPVRRGEAATFLVRALGAELTAAPASGRFPDVSASAYYAAPIEHLAAAGVLTGYLDGTFRPEATLTRAEMGAVLVRALQAGPPQSTAGFVDVPAQAWFAGHVDRLAELGVTRGCGAKAFCPDAPVSRAEMATFLTRAFRLTAVPTVARLAPLTGLPIADPATFPRRGIAVKIDNHRGARPQTGMADAEVVFETLVEDELTRWMALYHLTDLSKVGPIRSARPTDTGLLLPLGATLAVSGGQPWILDQMEVSGVPIIRATRSPTGFRRIAERTAPHNLYGDVAALRLAGAGWSDEPPPPLWQFGPLPASSTLASRLTLHWSDPLAVTWEWTGTGYRRVVDGLVENELTAHGRLNPIVTDVVIVLVGEVHTVSPPPGTVGRPVPAIETVGSGQAMVMAGGRLVVGGWRRDRLTDPFLLKTTTGEPLAVPPGRAWISVFPSNRPIWSHS